MLQVHNATIDLMPLREQQWVRGTVDSCVREIWDVARANWYRDKVLISLPKAGRSGRIFRRVYAYSGIGR